MAKRICRFCRKELDENHFFFCCEFCESCFREDYEIKTEVEREKLVGETYRAV